MSVQEMFLSLQDKADQIPDFTEHMGSFINSEIIMSRKTSFGGCTNEILGPQGTGKTSLMLSYVCRIMEMYPDEIVIWRDSLQSQCQFNRIKDWQIYAQEGVSLVFRDIYRDEVIDVPILFFDDFSKLESMVCPSQLNVVYVKDQVVDFIRMINHFRRRAGWQSFFIDEYEDIAPLNQGGFKYDLIGALGGEMKNIRKGLVSLFCNTQSKTQIDWRVRDTFMVETYLSGAKKDKYTSVYQEAINSLEKGTAWVSWEGKFGRINYPAFEPLNPIMDCDDINQKNRLDVILEKMD